MAGVDDSQYELLRVSTDDGVAVVVIDAPPVNVMTVQLFLELARFADEVAADESVRVVVLRSDHPDFFIAHFDVNAILAIPTDRDALRPDEPNGFHRMCETYRTMPKVTIAEIGGRVGGGGSELAMSCDMRFGALGRTVVNQMEVPLGILPGGTGTQRLPRLVGLGRAMEIVLGADDLDAETAERWGYLNRALPPDDLRPFVERLARRIASFPPTSIALAKQSVNNAVDLPLRDGLLEEQYLFERLLRTPESPDRMRRFLELGGQTQAGEAHVADLSAELGRDQ